MANDSLTITTNELRESSNSIKGDVEELKTALETATRVINQTEESFQGTAADEIRSRFTALSSKFNDFYEAITSYASFLESTANKYDETESAIKKSADDVLTSDYSA